MITDIIKYFAEMIENKSNVVSYFAAQSEQLNPQEELIYADIKAHIQALPDVGKIPGLHGFLFGNSEELIIEYEKNMPKPFLLVLYPDINSTYNGNNQGTLTIAVFENYSKKNKNIFQQAAIMQNCLNLLYAIIAQLKEDSYLRCPALTNISTDALQIIPDTLHGNIGYSVILQFESNV